MVSQQKPCAKCSAMVNTSNYSRHFRSCVKGLKGVEKQRCPICGNEKGRSNIRRHIKSCRERISTVDRDRRETSSRGDNVRGLEASLTHLTLPFDVPSFRSPSFNCVFAENIEYLEKVKEHSQLAKPDEWLSLLSGQSVAELSHHSWAREKVDYTLAWEERDIDMALKTGLRYPVLVPAESPLGQRQLYLNDANQNLSDLTITQLLDLALPDGDLTIDAQDLSASDVKNLMCLKACKEVKGRFAVPQEQRGVPINCPAVRENLFSNFPGPSLLESQDLIQRLLSGPDSRIEFEREDRLESQEPGTSRRAKFFDRWLLITEKGAVTKDHVDAVVASWVRCIEGEKILWFQNGLTEGDLSVWKKADDPRAYGQPWAAVRLRKGDTFIFPPGLVYVVCASEDTICTGGHFLSPAMMDRVITTIKSFETKPYLTSNMPVDIFKVVCGFTDTLLRSNPYGLPPQQTTRYVQVLEDYISANSIHESCQDEDHIKRKEIFLHLLEVNRKECSSWP